MDAATINRQLTTLENQLVKKAQTVVEKVTTAVTGTSFEEEITEIAGIKRELTNIANSTKEKTGLHNPFLAREIPIDRAINSQDNCDGLLERISEFSARVQRIAASGIKSTIQPLERLKQKIEELKQ